VSYLSGLFQVNEKCAILYNGENNVMSGSTMNSNIMGNRRLIDLGGLCTGRYRCDDGAINKTPNT